MPGRSGQRTSGTAPCILQVMDQYMGTFLRDHGASLLFLLFVLWSDFTGKSELFHFIRNAMRMERTCEDLGGGHVAATLRVDSITS
jgi:hypothetical protein